jgi:hypothetical protein
LKTFIQKIYESRYYALGLFILYLLTAGALIFAIDYIPKEHIAELLKRWVPWNLKAGFLLLMIGVIICRRDIAGSIADLWKSGPDSGQEQRRRRPLAVFLILLVLTAFILTAFVAPRIHRIFYDEDIYASMGHVMALTGQTGMCHFGTQDYGELNTTWLSYYKEPSGWPFLMSLVFQVFGTNELYAFLLNNIMFAASVLVVFSITRVMTASYFPAFLAGLIYALIPHNLTWFNTVAAEPSAAFFAGLVVLCTVVYLKTGSARHLFLLAIIAPIACQMRPESGLIIIGTLPFMLLGGNRDGEGNKHRWKHILSGKEVWTAGLLAFILLTPHLLHLYAVSGESWGATGAKFSTEFFRNNLSINGPYYLKNTAFPAVFTVLALAGAVFSSYKPIWRLMIVTWFLLFWGIFLFFYAGSYGYGADVRFALLTFMPISILAGMGGESIRSWIERLAGYGKSVTGGISENSGETVRQTAGAVIVFSLIITWLPFMPLVRTVGQEAWGARADHHYAREFIKKIPEESIVLTQNVTMLLVWGKNAIQTYAGIQNPEIIRNLMDRYKGHVYFHYNFWCNTASEDNKNTCKAVMAKYPMEEIASADEQNYRYALYKMKLPK